MGYTTDFEGRFEFNEPISEELKNYINNFSNSRRMKRNVSVIKKIYPNWEDFSFNGDLGIDGEYFANPADDFGQTQDDSVMDYNLPPRTQPSLWCQWVVGYNGKYLEWDGGEKFYNYIEWLEYLIKNFFEPTGNILNGTVYWRGEEYDDLGKIIVEDNKVSIVEG